MRRNLILVSCCGASASIVPQALGLLLLDSSEFGEFSAIYLMFALGSSMLFSVVCDPWVICGGENEGGWPIYSSLLVLCCVLGGLGAAVIALPVSGSLLAVLTALGSAGASLYRIGGRYYLIHVRRWNAAVASDILTVVTTVSTMALATRLLPSVAALLAAWGLGNIAGSLKFPVPSFRLFQGIRWLRGNGETVRPLLFDSVIMDASSVGIPYLLLPVLGMSGFGIYRGVSNLSAPVRLLLAPIRPTIVNHPQAALSRKGLVKVFVASGGAGTLVVLILLLVEFVPVSVGVLAELVPFLLPVALYIVGAALVSVYALVCRSWRSPRLLVVGRVINTLAGITGPLVGFLVGALTGAIWGYAIGTFLSGLAWLVLALGARER